MINRAITGTQDSFKKKGCLYHETESNDETRRRSRALNSKYDIFTKSNESIITIHPSLLLL